MSYKPILFSTEMVRAILDGRKTQTRRVIAGTPDNTYRMDTDDGKEWFAYYGVGGEGWLADLSIPVKPRYRTGDALWVRETWCNINRPGIAPDYYYLADARNCEDYDPSEWKWRPSIFMPKEACRLFLRVTGVHAERVQDITEEDAGSEGVSWTDEACYNNGWHPTMSDPDSGGQPILQEGFHALWDSINAKRGYGWDKNPWVWVYTFERIDMPKGWPNV